MPRTGDTLQTRSRVFWSWSSCEGVLPRPDEIHQNSWYQTGFTLREKRVKKQVINISSRKPNLKRRIRRHLRKIGFHKTTDGALAIEGSGKDVIRALHESQRRDLLEKNREFMAQRCPALLKHFATGQEVEPRKILPVLDRISSGTWQSELFRLASLTWSIPVSNGFGRRLRV